MQLEMFLGMRQCVVGHQRGNVRKLSGLSLQEFLACRGIEKKIAHRDRGSLRQAGFFHQHNLAAIHLDDCARVVFCRARFQPQPRNRSNRGQRLPAKAEGSYMEQVIGITDL